MRRFLVVILLVAFVAGAVSVGAQDSQPTVEHHTVQSGETLSGIAAARGTTVQALRDANPWLGDPNVIHTGWVLHVVPVATTVPPATTQPPTTTVPATTTTAAPTTTVAPTTTTTVAPTTTTTTSTVPAGGDFVETFDGDGGLDRFRTGVFHRDVDAHGFPLSAPGERTWLADHNIHLDDCGNPATNHHIADKADRDSSFYVCRDHLMTTMGDADSYSVVWFSPDQTFDSVSRVCWDASRSRDLNGFRQWWEVAITPATDPDVTAIWWLAGTANLPEYSAETVVAHFGPGNPVTQYLTIGRDEYRSSNGHADPAGNTSTAIRRPFCVFELDASTIRYQWWGPDGVTSWADGPGRFPDGPVKVVFKDHSYTPNKDCEHMSDGLAGPGTCRSNSWHWDNIRVET